MPEMLERLTTSSADGDIVRRLMLPYLNHAVTMWGSGYATAADIDAAMRWGCGYPVGPLELVWAWGPGEVRERLHELRARTGDPWHQPSEALDGDGPHVPPVGGGTAAATRPVRSVAVAGTGTMAAGIVEVVALGGLDVVVLGRTVDKAIAARDRVARRLDTLVARGRLTAGQCDTALARITPVADPFSLSGVDLIIEAVAEDLDVKRKLFAELDAAAPEAMLATTTSSLSIETLADSTSRPAEVVGLHFFNPAPAMKLVEVVSGPETAAEVAETARMLCRRLGKHDVSCADRPGFIVNALLFPYLNDAVRWHVASGVAPAEIDEAMSGTGIPMGPFTLLDVVGLDVSLAIQRTLAEHFAHPSWQPAPLLGDLVAQGRLGRKTGAGFYDY